MRSVVAAVVLMATPALGDGQGYLSVELQLTRLNRRLGVMFGFGRGYRTSSGTTVGGSITACARPRSAALC